MGSGVSVVINMDIIKPIHNNYNIEPHGVRSLCGYNIDNIKLQ